MESVLVDYMDKKSWQEKEILRQVLRFFNRLHALPTTRDAILRLM